MRSLKSHIHARGHMHTHSRTAALLAQVVYDCRPVEVAWESFGQLRARVEAEWGALPPAADVLSPEIRQRRREVAAEIGVVVDDL